MRVLLIGNSVITPASFRECLNGQVELAGILHVLSPDFARDIAGSVDMVIAHSILPGNVNAAQLLQDIKSANPSCHTVLLVEHRRNKDRQIRGVDSCFTQDYHQQTAALVYKMTVAKYLEDEKSDSSPATHHKQSPILGNQKLGAYMIQGRKALRIAGNVLFGTLVIVMAVMAFFMVQSRLSGGVPSVAGYQLYVVLSGSMNPAFDTGSVVWVRSLEPGDVEVGDIITFSGRENQKFTTHRVVGILTDGGLRFITRGDANNVDDPNPVLPRQLVGKVHGSLAYVGYIMGFAQTRQGLLFLVFIPGVLIIGYELYNIYRYTTDPDKSKAA